MERVVSSSFRDPSGHLYWEDGLLYRRISPAYQATYRYLMDSGLYQELVNGDLLIPHEEVSPSLIRPEIVRTISYPYEWSFSMLKDAALATLELQRKALEYGMSLKDASAYNIQFHKRRPLLIDTLSLYLYKEGEPWGAYRQFCQHFLNPLALAAYRDVRLLQYFKASLDGYPLDFTTRLLPFRARCNYGLLLHLYLHSAGGKVKVGSRLPKSRLGALLQTLVSTIEGLKWKPKGTWEDYTKQYDYSNFKAHSVEDLLRETGAKTAWDLGANVGLYSRVASDLGMEVVAIDSDPACVELCYLSNGLDRCLPLLVDLTNPSPGIGWMNKERDALSSRGPTDVVMALALIHHLAIGNNLPLESIAEFLASLGHWLIVEWVPKEDPRVQLMLSTREDIFPDYTQKAFEESLTRYFRAVRMEPVKDSLRVLYLMEKRDDE